MIVEGKGLCAPSPWRRKLTRGELLIALDSATRIANYRSYGRSRSSWKRGLVGSLSIPGIADNIRADLAPRVLGTIGEIAVGIFFSIPIDDRLKSSGDGDVDFKIGKASSQVKTRPATSAHAKDRVNLLRAVDERGRNVMPRVPVLVFCEFDTSSWFVSVLGWCRTVNVAMLPKVKARKGNHLNIEITDSILEPLSSLKALAYDSY